MIFGIKAAKAHLKPFGVTITRSEGTYRVNLLNGFEDTAVYSTDLTDAIRAGEAIGIRSWDASNEQRMWEIILPSDVDESHLRAILDAQFTGYNMIGGSQWLVNVLADKEAVERCVRTLSAQFTVTFRPASSSGYFSYELMTEDVGNDDEILHILRRNGITKSHIQKTQGFYQNVQEPSITIGFSTYDHETVLKIVTEIGVLNRQLTVAIRRGDDVRFVQAWHAHTVAGQVVTA
jgi:hypothetical protein